MTAPLMPRATAVWLVENTTLTFKQIADFCELHELEVQAIADGDVSFNIIGINPLETNQLTAEEIKRCEADKRASLQANELELNVRLKNAKAKSFCLRLSAATNPAPFSGLLKIVRKLLILRFVSWSEPQSRRLLPSATERTMTWLTSGLKIRLPSVCVPKKNWKPL